MKIFSSWYNGLAGQPISFDPSTPQMNPYLAALQRKREAGVIEIAPHMELTSPRSRLDFTQHNAGRAA